MTDTTGNLEGKVALVTGATRGAGRGIAVDLGAAGATVYATGRTTSTASSPMGRPETIEETARLVEAAGGHGLAVPVDHSQPDQVRRLVEEIEISHGRSDVLVHDTWAGDALTQWGAMLDHFGVTEDTWHDAIEKDPHLAFSETPHYIGRAVAALAADPAKSERSGGVTATWELAREYGFTDVDGTRPDWGRHALDALGGAA